MKTHIVFLAILVGASPLLAMPSSNNPAPSKTASAAARRLQITVFMPANYSSIWTDNLAHSLSTLVKDTFRKDGYRGQLAVVAAGNQTQPGVPTLEINLINWHVNLTRSIDCTVNAVLKNANGEQNLGVFEGRSLSMFDVRSPFERAVYFDEAASKAISQLYDELRQKNLLLANAE